jgi:hypothetical protein
MRTIVQYLFLLIFFFTMTEISVAQTYIGKHKNEVKQLMKDNRKNFSLDESSINTAYNLLKFVDHNDTQTFLFVFNENDTCKYYKLIYDYSFLNEIQKELDKKYTRSEEDLWYFNDENKKFEVTLKKDDWYFSVLTKEFK